MRPARKSKRRIAYYAKKKKGKKGVSSLAFYSVLAVFIIASIIILFFNKKYFDGNSKIPVVIQKTSGDLALVVFDTKNDEINEFNIPKDTQFDVSRQLGSYKVASIWQLGINEHLQGDLVSESIVKTLKLPVLVWAEPQAYGFAKGGFFNILKSVIVPYKTNLNLSDKIRLGIFSLSVGKDERSYIDLAQTQQFKRVGLPDGSLGYTPPESLSENITVYFVDELIQSKNYRVRIQDFTGDYSSAAISGEVIENIGAKVASVDKREKNDSLDCLVTGKDKYFTEKIAQLFGCTVDNSKDIGNFDLEMSIGTKFAKRY